MTDIYFWSILAKVGITFSGLLFLVDSSEGIYITFLIGFPLLRIIRVTLCVCFRVAEGVYVRFSEEGFFFEFFCLASRIVICVLSLTHPL